MPQSMAPQVPLVKGTISAKTEKGAKGIISDMFKLPKQAEAPAIGARIKIIREMFGETQEDFSRRIAVSRGRLKNWEVGTKRPSLDAALAICEASGVDLDYLILGRESSLSMDLRKRLERASIQLSERPL